MGYGNGIKHEDMKDFSTTRNITSTTRSDEIFKATRMNDLFNPALIKLPRESCDSASCPRSRGVILAYDVSGSMGYYPTEFIKSGMPKLNKYLYDESTLSFNSHIMINAIDDVAARNPAPFQVTQFESDIRIMTQLEQIYLEGLGGGNGSESYALAWYFAGKFIKMDCLSKREEKGFLFTFGDEGPTPSLSHSELSTVFGKNDPNPPYYLTSYDCLDMAKKKFECYHIVPRTSYSTSSYNNVLGRWRDLMGKNRVCDLSDHDYLPELVVTILRMHDGLSKTEAINMLRENRARRVVSKALEYHEERVEDAASPTKKTPSDDIEVF